MNPNVTGPQSKIDRLGRIKIVSQIMRYIIFALFVFSILIWFPSFLHNGSLPAFTTTEGLGHALLNVLLTAALSFWYWNLAKLFRFYERGLIFAAETIHCIKTLGVLCAVNWLLLLCLNVMNRWFPVPPPPPLPPHVKVTVVKSSFGMGFFSFSIDGINFGSLLAGMVIILIAWIMDEGRKIQEEQDLTV